MLKCNSLNEILRDDDLCIDLNYITFKLDITIFVYKFLKNLDNGKRIHFPIIIFSNEICEEYKVIGNNIILINECIIEGIYYSYEKKSLLKLFYTLSKIRGDILINNGIVNIRTINTIKDYLLIDFQEKVNEKKNKNNVSYSEMNYKNISSEVYAKVDGIIWYIDYCKENGICISEIKLLEKYNKLLKKLENKTRKILVGYHESKKINLDDLFDLSITDNPDWLKRYPHLQTEYYIENNVIKRRDFSKFELSDIDNLNEDNDFKEYVKSLVVRDRYRLIKNEDIGKVKKKQKKK